MTPTDEFHNECQNVPWTKPKQLANIGDIIKVPKSVCESGYIKIVAYDPSDAHPDTSHANWDYKAQYYEPTEPNRYFPLFEVSTEELQRWLNNGEG